MDVKEVLSVDASGPMPTARVDTDTGYFYNIDDIRKVEYPILQGQQYGTGV